MNTPFADSGNQAKLALDACRTRWPLLLVHGIASRRAERLAYWGQIPDALQAYGARVYISNQDAWGSYQSNAEQLRQAVMQILADEGAQKVNIIAHSKGGLDSRALAALPGMNERIASITTLATPHFGLRTLNYIRIDSVLIQRLVSTLLDVVLILTGETNPSIIPVLNDLSERSMRVFNASHPLPEGIYVQSFSLVQKGLQGKSALALTEPIIKAIEGDNDGIVPTWSAKFGEYRGVLDADGEFGLTHVDITNRSLAELVAKVIGLPYSSKSTLTRDGFDVLHWWAEMVADLRQRGY
jgi:triacylglycerol lipase